MWGRRKKAHWLSFEQMSSRLVNLPFLFQYLTVGTVCVVFLPLPSPFSRTEVQAMLLCFYFTSFNASRAEAKQSICTGNGLVQMQAHTKTTCLRKDSYNVIQIFFFKENFPGNEIASLHELPPPKTFFSKYLPPT